MRSVTVSLALIAAAVVLVGCGSPSSSPSSSPPAPTLSITQSPSLQSEGEDPVGLLGTWRISRAEGEGPDSWIRLGAGSFDAWARCGQVSGSWVANSRQFGAVEGRFVPECLPERGARILEWLSAAESYEKSAEGWLLRDGDDEVVAALTEDSGPLPAEWQFDWMVSTDADRARAYFSTDVDLPRGIEPATLDRLPGRWFPFGAYTADPYVEFSPSGAWKGTDGCNGGGGRFVLSPGGAFTSTSSASTLIGCDGAPVPDWVTQARALGFDGSELVLMNAAGGEIARLMQD
jgi:hypothetical protein